MDNWLSQYPRAAALLQGDEEELLYDADADADADADEVTQHQDASVHARLGVLVFHARTPWPSVDRIGDTQVRARWRRLGCLKGK